MVVYDWNKLYNRSSSSCAIETSKYKRNYINDITITLCRPNDIVYYEYRDNTSDEKNITFEIKKMKEPAEMKSMSLIRVVVLDLDERVPMTNRILHDSGEFWSEDKNEDIYYNINLKETLESHNDLRSILEWEDVDCNGKLHKVVGLPEIKYSDLTKEVIKYVTFNLKQGAKK